jgi:ubiquinone/menaquinone biosynthesis C-methylase UbiE
MNTKDFWNQRANHYDNSVNKTYADAYQKTIDLTCKHVNREDKLLAFACGTGIVSNAIAPHVQHVTGIDISDKMIAIAQQKAEQDGIENVSYAVANLEDVEIRAGNYTIITAFNVLYFLEDLDQKLKLIYDMLPENGYFLSVTDCVSKEKGLKPFFLKILMKLGIVPFIRQMTPVELTGNIEKAGFKILLIENLHTEPPNLYVVAQKQS